MAQTKRYQIFVSSTYRDLKAERREVIEAILELHHLPLGMEMFPASNVAPPEYIKRAIAESDYYVVIVGNRYGTPVPGSGLSFTEMEYDHAIACGVPVVAMLHENPSSLPDESDDERREKLAAFSKKLQSATLVKYWSSTHELARKVTASLSHMFRDEDRPGWIRSLGAPLPRAVPNSIPDEDYYDLSGSYTEHDGTIRRWQKKFRGKDLFLLVLGVFDENSGSASIAYYVMDALFAEAAERNSASVKNFQFEDNCFFRLFSLLRYHELIQSDAKNEHWSLTPLGRKYYLAEHVLMPVE